MNPGGKVFLAVPDTEIYQKSGDISMLLHEHWSYFTQKALFNFFNSLGGFDPRIEKATFGGSLYCAAKINNQASPRKPIDSFDEFYDDDVENFVSQMNEMNFFLEKLINNARDKKRTLAVYVPGRIINMLSVTGIDSSHMRFIDDNFAMHGCFFPGFSQQVEDRKALIKNPTNEVLIMSNTFGNKIKRSLQKELPSSTNIFIINELEKLFK